MDGREGLGLNAFVYLAVNFARNLAYAKVSQPATLTDADGGCIATAPGSAAECMIILKAVQIEVSAI